MVEKVWGGRFKSETQEIVETFTSSLPFDIRLWKEDIEGNRAYCLALKEAGVLAEEEAQRILSALEEIARDLESGKVELDPRYEDIHTLVEGLLREKVGEIAGKLHTGRSRNDQVVLDLRLWLRETILRQRGKLQRLMGTLVEKAEESFGIIAPGYTHLRKAQPVLLSHYFMAHYEMLRRDLERLNGCLKRVNVLPLGSSALSGNPYPIDRNRLAQMLGFEEVSPNSIDTVSDRDFVLEYLAVVSISMVHLSRLSEDLIIWSGTEFGYVELPESFCTGSSIMPQKKNPDVLELIRGKTGRTVGAFVSVATTLKGLPLTYNRDLQEDKEPLFDAVDTYEGVLDVLVPLIKGLKVNRERMERAALEDFSLATELADYLALKGVPFREAHKVVGRIVLYCEESNKGFNDLTLEELRGFHPAFEKDVFDWLDPLHALNRRDLPGGTSPRRVKEAIQRAKEELGL